MLHRAKRRQRGCFQRVYNVEKGFTIHKQPFSGSKILFSHSASPLSLLVSSACSCSPAGRYKTRLYGRQPCSALISARTRHRDDLAPMQEKCKQPPRATTRSQPKLQPTAGAKLAVANGVVPLATFVPRTQSRLLFYSHEKLSWTVKISHSKFWYEAP